MKLERGESWIEQLIRCTLHTIYRVHAFRRWCRHCIGCNSSIVELSLQVYGIRRRFFHPSLRLKFSQCCNVLNYFSFFLIIASTWCWTALPHWLIGRWMLLPFLRYFRLACTLLQRFTRFFAIGQHQCHHSAWNIQRVQDLLQFSILSYFEWSLNSYWDLTSQKSTNWLLMTITECPLIG